MGKVLLGAYVFGMIISFISTCFMVYLTGDVRELWRIPVYTVGWPVMFVMDVGGFILGLFC